MIRKSPRFGTKRSRRKNVRPSRMCKEPRVLRFLALCLLSLVLTSCVRGYNVELFNNTGEALTVTSYDTAGGATEKSLPIGGKVRITGSRFTLRNAHREWKYSLLSHPPPARFIDDTHWNRLVCLQVEKNGAIYILLPSATSTTSTLPTQPSGFPITPGGRRSKQMGSPA